MASQQLQASLSPVASSALGAASPEEIRIADNVDPATSIPGNFRRNASTDMILAHVVESLVALKADMSVGPMLADSWDISDGGTTYTFHLRQHVLFQNGAPMTSAEVKWSYDFDMSKRSGFSCQSAYNGRRGVKVLSVSTPDPTTVVFRLEKPSALFLASMTDPRCPLAVLHPDSVGRDNAWIKPIGTGPYNFTQWRQGTDVLLTPFPGYRPRREAPSGMAGAKHAYENLRFVTIPDEAGALSALLAGQIDVMTVSENGIPDMPKGTPLAWRLVSGPGADPTALLMQTHDAVLSDPRIRRAIALSLDLPGIAGAVSDGRAAYNSSLLSIADKLYSAEQARGYQENLAEAKRLLAQAGYAGQPLTLETNRRYPHMYSLAIYVQSLLARAGLRVRLDVVEWGKQLADFHAGRFQMMSFGYTARINPALMYEDVIGDKRRNPMAQWDDPHAAAILAGINATTDPAQRQAAFDQLHAMMIDDTPMIIIFDSPDLILESTRINGLRSWPMRLKLLYNVTKD